MMPPSWPVRVVWCWAGEHWYFPGESHPLRCIYANATTPRGPEEDR